LREKLNGLCQELRERNQDLIEAILALTYKVDGHYQPEHTLAAAFRPCKFPKVDELNVLHPLILEGILSAEID
jgi:hypothetical protein